MPGACVGLIIGGAIPKKFSFGPTGLIKQTIFAAACGLVLSPIYLIHCPAVPVAGITVPYFASDRFAFIVSFQWRVKQLGLYTTDYVLVSVDSSAEIQGDPTVYHTCNEPCNCTTESYDPICGTYDNVQYFSPCIGGCQVSWDAHDGEVIFRFRSFVETVFSVCSRAPISLSDWPWDKIRQYYFNMTCLLSAIPRCYVLSCHCTPVHLMDRGTSSRQFLWMNDSDDLNIEQNPQMYFQPVAVFNVMCPLARHSSAEKVPASLRGLLIILEKQTLYTRYNHEKRLHYLNAVYSRSQAYDQCLCVNTTLEPTLDSNTTAWLEPDAWKGQCDGTCSGQFAVFLVFFLLQLLAAFLGGPSGATFMIRYISRLLLYAMGADR